MSVTKIYHNGEWVDIAGNGISVIDNLTSTSATDALSANQGRILNNDKEDRSNKVTSISSVSTDEEYPSAKAVYDAIPLVGQDNAYKCIPNTTTYAEVTTALNAGKLPYLVIENGLSHRLFYAYTEGTGLRRHCFTRMTASGTVPYLHEWYCGMDNIWAEDTEVTQPLQINNGSLTIKKNGTSLQTFRANQSTDVIADITVPVISTSETGTSTDEINYITIDGVEKKIAGGGRVLSVNGKEGEVVLTASDVGAIGKSTSSEGEYFYTFAGESQLTNKELVSDITSITVTTTDEMIPTAKAVTDLSNTKQDKLTAGDNISINNNLISAIDTKVATSITLGLDLIATEDVGGVLAGDFYSSTTTLAELLRDIIGGVAIQGYIYRGVGSDIPTSVEGMEKVGVASEVLVAHGHIWRNVALNNEYPFLAIDKSLGIICYEIIESFSMDFITEDLGEQLLYYPKHKGTDDDITLTYHFKEV